MKKKKRNVSSVRVGAIAAVAAFALLTILAGGGLVEVSREIGTAKWLASSAAYMLANKLGAKLMAALAVGAVAAFVNSMIEYGANATPRRRSRTMRVDFSVDDGEVSRTA